MLGDQVYADEVAPATEEFIRARRDVDVPPGLQISDFEEYCRLYRDAWCEPAVRWLLSTVPTAMIFDDHDVIDDWNTSRDWVAQMRAKGWWDERIVGAFMSYWCYQHLGNLSPEDREEDACYRAVRAAEGDAGAIVRDFAFRADREVAGARWSYKRDIGRTRIVMMDSRAGRVLEPGRALDGRRRGVGLHRGVDARRLRPPAAGHLAAGLPRARDALPGGLERGGRPTARGARWPRARPSACARASTSSTGRRSATRCARSSACSATSPPGGAAAPPGTVVLLSGDVHHAYIAEARPADGQPAWQAPVYQAVCSPLRNPLDANERRAIKLGDDARRRARRARPGPRGAAWRTSR